MKARDTKRINALLTEIKILSAGLPKGKSNMVQNRCSKISLIIRKQQRYEGKI